MENTYFNYKEEINKSGQAIKVIFSPVKNFQTHD